MNTANESTVTPNIANEATEAPATPQVNHRARAIEMIEKALAPLLEFRAFMQTHPQFTAAEFSDRWEQFSEDHFRMYAGLATDEVYNVRGGSERLNFPLEKLPDRFIDPKAPVRQQLQAAIDAVAEHGDGLLAFLRTDPDGFDLLGYGTALHRVEKAIDRWGNRYLIGNMIVELMTS